MREAVFSRLLCMEEAQVILRGQGDALIDGQEKRPFAAPALVYSIFGR
jgi:hypothetical protein